MDCMGEVGTLARRAGVQGSARGRQGMHARQAGVQGEAGVGWGAWESGERSLHEVVAHLGYMDGHNQALISGKGDKVL